MTRFSSMIGTVRARRPERPTITDVRGIESAGPGKAGHWRRRVHLSIASGLALLAASCAPSPGPSTPSGPSNEPELTGTNWRLIEFESSDDAIGTIRPAQDDVYTLHLDPDGTLAAGLACNRATGRWTSPDTTKTMGSLTLELNAVTSAACLNARFERLATNLGHIRSFVIRDGRLHLNLKLDGGNYVWVPE